MLRLGAKQAGFGLDNEFPTKAGRDLGASQSTGAGGDALFGLGP